ncbi:MAG: hypothetical protein WA866_16305, partial [Pseudolabrys sp.]
LGRAWANLLSDRPFRARDQFRGGAWNQAPSDAIELDREDWRFVHGRLWHFADILLRTECLLSEVKRTSR